jgi:hypothetical protein
VDKSKLLSPRTVSTTTTAATTTTTATPVPFFIFNRYRLKKFNSIQFNSIYFQIPNACTTKISQFMKYSYVRESL